MKRQKITTCQRNLIYLTTAISFWNQRYHMQKEFITLYQRPASPLPENRDPEYKFLLKTGSVSNTLIFPEYFTFHSEIRNLDSIFSISADTLKKLFRLSTEPSFEDTMIVGGTIIFSKDDFLFNATPVLLNGSLLGYYFKRKLFSDEARFLTCGDKELVIEHPVTHDKWGFLICADVHSSEYFAAYSQVRYIAIPTASPFLPQDTHADRLHRDLSIYQNGAQKSQAVIFKCCLTGQPGAFENENSPVKHRKVQGRSIIASPQEILARAPDIDWRGTLSYSIINAHVKVLTY